METTGEEEPSSHDTIPHTVSHPPDDIASPHDTIPHTLPHPPDGIASPHDTIQHTVPHPPDGIASPHDTIPHTVPHPPSSHDTIPHTVPHPPSSHDTIPHTVSHPPDDIASPTNSAEDFTQPPVDLSQASDHNTPRGTVQHHDYHPSTVPTQLAQPMDVEASFPQDMMEASVAGAVAPGYTTNSNEAPVHIYKQSKCQTNIAETINSSNTFKINQVHNAVHNHNRVHIEQHVHQPHITYTISHAYITGDQEIPFQAVTGATEHGALSSEDDEAVDNMVTTDSFRRALDILTTGERLLLLSAHPGLTRQSFLSALRRQYRKKGYTVYDLSCVSDWDKKGPVERGSLVIFDCAFGDVRLDKEQYHRFYKHSLYSINSLTTKLVFVVYPPVLLELQQFDRASVRPLLNSVELVELGQDPLLSVEPYADLLVRMLRDPNHGLILAALFALTMQGQGFFSDNTSQAQPPLERLGFSDYSDAQLEEYASLLKGFLLAHRERGFISREVYDAVGLAFANTYLKSVLVQVCDTMHLVQFVETEYPVEKDPLLMRKIVEEMIKGRLPEMIQHPCLHSEQFLCGFEAFCRENNCLQAVIGALDPDHNLPLLYWSVWGPSDRLTEWCIRMTKEQNADSNIMSDHVHSAAFGTALLKALQISKSSHMFRKLLSKITDNSYTENMRLPVPSTDQRHTAELRSVCDKIPSGLRTSHFQFIGVLIPKHLITAKMKDEIIHISFPRQHVYLTYRLLTDQQVDEQDREGNTLLHLAAEAGHLEAIKMAVRSGASLTVKNEAGKTPPQLAKQRLDQHNYDTQCQEKCTRSMFAACTVGDVTTVKECLCYHATVDSKDKNGLTPLHIASYIASLLADLDANLNATAKSGLTPLHYACRRQCLEKVQLLVKRGSFVNAMDYGGITALHTVCRQGDKDIAELLILHNAHVDAKTSVGWTPLHLACDKGQKDVAQLLLQFRADINTTSREGHTPLHMARTQSNTDIVRLLVANRADVNVTNTNNNTPLHCACYGNKANNVRLLLDHGADVNVQNKHGETALHVACWFCNTDVVRLLLGCKDAVSVSDDEGKSPSTVMCEPSAKVDINMKDNKGETALYKACEAGHIGAVRLLLQQENIDVNAASDGSWSPLLMVCIVGPTDIAQLHLLHKADVNMSGALGLTPLNWACMHGYLDVVHLLLQHGADVNISGERGMTALNFACVENHHKIVRLLLQHGANVNIFDMEGETVLLMACTHGHQDIVQYVLQHNERSVLYTALKRAQKHGHREIVQLLQQYLSPSHPDSVPQQPSLQLSAQ
ncbi:uncharacterized protein [Littorina saxatilis]|uniref:Novel STAND NTPase 3 domain-containing protein n=1 Tax=Littorina saxatilis TaxID=31220 RepID=A0AAN9AX52_9CAEN